MLHRIKFQQSTLDSFILSTLFAQRLNSIYNNPAAPLSLPEIILPVPLSHLRLFQRGYNQSAGIARHLGSVLNVPVNYRALKRIVHTAPQTALKQSQRRANVRKAFKVAATLNCHSIALVDDVMTTGATLFTLAECARNAGIREIHLWALARTPQATTERKKS